MKNFKDWRLQDLRKTFGLNEQPRSFNLLADLLHTQTTQTLEQKAILKKLFAKLDKKAGSWNEEELKMRFISPLLELVEFDGEQYTLFYDRPLSADIGEIRLNGIADMLVATGEDFPEEPFLFLHEYKPEHRVERDPKGQLLAAMLAAQTLNKDKNLPLYGCYIIGRLWFFTILQGKNYAISGSFDASTENGISLIFNILQKIKANIEAYLSLK